MTRAAVRKTYKLYVGGAFVRSESGRSDAVGGVNVPRGSRKDVRDAVKAARAAFPGWAGRTAYNRGQVLYRFAEALESRGADPEAIDTLVHYAGWTDKLAAVMGGVNPVAAPYLSFSLPEPTGVVAVLAPDEPDVLGLVREVAPALAAGNVVVAVVSRVAPLGPLDLGEVAGVSDVPAGVLNLLSGRLDELLAPLCGHRDVNAVVDATGVESLAAEIDSLAAETVKRVVRPTAGTEGVGSNSLARLEALTELKTAWHPVGA